MDQNTEHLLTYEQLLDRKALHEHVHLSPYITHEIAIRERLHQFLIRDTNITEILYTCPWESTHHAADVLVVSAGTSIYIEAKERTWHSTAFSDWMIDNDKLDRLLDLQDHTGILAMWCSIYPDDITMIWWLHDHTSTGDVTCDAKTFQKDLGKKSKPSHFYPSTAAIHITL